MIHADVLGERARVSPERTALVLAESGWRFSYRELDARARAAARLLLGLGLSRGDRLAVLTHNRVEFLDLFFACAKTGIVFVPLGTRLTARELAPIVEDAGAGVLVYDPALEEVARGIAIPRAVSFAEFPGLQQPAQEAWPAPEPEDLCALLYTSGTTGAPKGVMLPHRMMGWNAYNTAVAWGLGQDDVSPLFLPLYHAGGLGAFLLPILLAGGTIVLHAKFEADEVWRTIEREGATVVLGVPTVWKMLLESPELPRVKPPRLKWLISGGAPLPFDVLAAYRERGFVLKQGYGMTEVGVNCFTMSVEESVTKAGSVGRPLPFTRAKLVDETGAEVAAGEVGELCLAGPHVSLGYWRGPAARTSADRVAGDLAEAISAAPSAAAFEATTFFHTGDLARCDEDGFYTIVGRRKDMYISGGVNVSPAEIETVLREHPSVRDVAVAGVPDATWGEVGVAFVVPNPGGPLDAEALTRFVEDRLARFKVPKAFVPMAELPLTAYGKVVKEELRKRYLAAAASPPLSHRVDGAGAETLLLLNGGAMSYSVWEPMVAELARELRVVRCDFRGQLLSPGEAPQTLAGHVADVVALLDHLGLPGVHVLGTSFGAQVGLLLAATHPTRVRSLSAVTAVDHFDGGMLVSVDEARAACRAVPSGGDRKRVFDLVAATAYSPRFAEAHRELLESRRSAVAALPESWFRGLEGLLASLHTADLRPVLGAIRCPTLVIAAEEDAAMPLAHTRAVAEAIRGARFQIVPASGHAVILERTGEVVTRFRDFFVSLEQEASTQ